MGAMQINKATDYGLRALAFMASQSKGKVWVVKEISEATNVTKNYLLKVLKRLEKAGLALSHRGSQGGYSLTCNPEKITFLEIVQALEGPPSLNVCLHDSEVCPRARNCSIHPIWSNVQEKMKEEMARYTLSEFALRNHA